MSDSSGNVLLHPDPGAGRQSRRGSLRERLGQKFSRKSVSPLLKRKVAPSPARDANANSGASQASSSQDPPPQPPPQAAPPAAPTAPSDDAEADMVGSVHSGGSEPGQSVALSSNGTSGGPPRPTGSDEGDGGEKHKAAALKHLQHKVEKTREKIRQEQAHKEGNVNEYLQLTSKGDKEQLKRVKQAFEKKNQKTAIVINQLQRKLETYQAQLRQVEQFGVSPRRPGDVLRDVGHGINNMVSRKHMARIKSKFGSADNIANLKSLEEEGVPGVAVTSEEGSPTAGRRHKPGGSGTLPPSFRYGSEADDSSSITSGSGVQSGPPAPGLSGSPGLGRRGPGNAELDTQIRRMMQRLEEQTTLIHRLQAGLDAVSGEVRSEMTGVRGAVEDQQLRLQQLEHQVADVSELHQSEVTNLKQEMSAVTEKQEYQLEERTNDMQDLLENLQTRMGKLEVAQQQQQVISMEGVENANARAVITKLMNVLLAVLAVLLVMVNTLARLLAPLFSSAARGVLSVTSLLALLVTWHYRWPVLQSTAVKLGIDLHWGDTRT